MTKKNTLLYLDTDLVKRAKKSGMNISKAAEYGIKIILDSEETDLEFNPSLDLAQMIFDKNAFVLPLKIKMLELANIGLFERKRVVFKDGINIITGKGITGKTTLINSIAYIFNGFWLAGFVTTEKISEVRRLIECKNRVGSIIRDGANDGKLRLEFQTEAKFIEFEYKKHKSHIKNNAKHLCVLIDDPFYDLLDNQPTVFLKYLKMLGSQVVITCDKLPDINLDNANIIKL